MAEQGHNVDDVRLRREEVVGLTTEELRRIFHEQKEKVARIEGSIDRDQQQREEENRSQPEIDQDLEQRETEEINHAVIERHEGLLNDIKPIHSSRKDRKPSKREVSEIIVGINHLCSQSSVDIRTIPEADNLKEEIKEFLETEILTKLVDRGYEGRFRTIGSTFDRTRISSSTDFDFFFEINSAPTLTNSDLKTFELTGTGYSRSVVMNDQKLNPWEFYELFARDLFNIFSTLDRLSPEGITFGGFASPKFSGVRYNEPAVTILFNWHEVTVTSVDITPALRIPDDNLPQFPELSKKLTNLLRLYSDTNEPEICQELHLVPIWLDKQDWCVTTAALEQRLFSVIRDEPVRNTIKECKLKCKRVTDSIHEQYQRGFEEFNLKKSQEIYHLLETYKYNRHKELQANKVEELRALLMDILSVGHIFLSQNKAAEFFEIGSKLVSINSSALKYLALNSTTENCHSSHVLEQLQALNPVQHTFLSYPVAKLSVNYILTPKLQTIRQEVYRSLENESTD